MPRLFLSDARVSQDDLLAAPFVKAFREVFLLNSSGDPGHKISTAQVDLVW
jgi:hypothetical protein